MKIAKNIIPVIKIYKSLSRLKALRKEIRSAKAAGDLEKEREAIRKAGKLWGETLIEDFNVTVNVYGEENLPKEGPVVFVGNHQSYADPVVCLAKLSTIQFAFVAKQDLTAVPLYSQWIEEIRSVFIERDDPRESLKAIQRGVALIEQGFSLMIFPEGTRSKGGEMAEFKKGSLRLATKPQVPVIPVTISGTYKLFEEPGFFKGDHVDMIIHEPIETRDLSKTEQHELAEKVEAIVRKGLESLQ